MSFNIKKKVILSIAILLPLIVAAFIGSYVYNRSELQTAYRTELLSFGTYATDDCGSNEATDECIEYYKKLAKANTTDKKIAKYIKYGITSAYIAYNPVPVYNMDVTQEVGGEDLKMFHLAIYRAVFDGDSVADTISLRWYYVVFIYDINYTNLRAFITNGKDEAFTNSVNTSIVPKLTARVFSKDDPLEEGKDASDPKHLPYSISGYKTRSVSFSEDRVVPDYEATPTFNINDTKGKLNYIYAGVVRLGAGKTSEEGYDNWYIPASGTTSSVLRVTMSLDVNDDDKEGEEEETYSLDDIELENFLVGDASAYKDDSSYISSYRQSITKAGYIPWVVKHYMWWACLLAFVIMGLITFAFYAIWLSDAKERQAYANRHRKK